MRVRPRTGQSGVGDAAEFSGWAPELTALITDGETAPVPRMIYTLPDAHRWDRVRVRPQRGGSRGCARDLDLCLGDRAPYGLIEFLTGLPEEGHDRPAQS
jgi:hypothetical protein